LYLKEEEFINAIASVEMELTEDEENPVVDDDICMAGHATLKQSVPTRWNSVLTMINSLLSLQKETNEVLKRIGKHDLLLRKEDIEEMQGLHALLTPFQEFTLIVSEVAPNLSVIPLIRGRIKKLCTNQPKDLPGIKGLKQMIAKNLDKRLPVSKLVNIACSFDPSVRDIVLKKEEAKELLLDLHEDLVLSK